MRLAHPTFLSVLSLPILSLLVACGSGSLGSGTTTAGSTSTGTGSSTGAGGPGSGTTTGTGTVTGPCAALAATCAQSQQGCVESDSGAKCVPCGAGTYATAAGSCDPLPGTTIVHDFPDQTVKSGQEILGLCRSWTMNNDTEIWVNAVELNQNEDSHHSNFTWVPDDTFTGADGIWTCSDRKWDIYSAIAAGGGLVYAQSTQAAHEVQKFPSGAAVRVPPHSRIISDIHLLDTSSSDVTGHATLTLYTIDASEATTKLNSWHVEYDALDIPAHATSRFTGACNVAGTVSAATGEPFAPKLYYLLPHTHTLASGFFAQVLGGPNDGLSLLDLGGFNGEAHGKVFDPPIDMTGADGVTFACQYTNTRDTSVGWGFGSAEMCELFGFAADTPYFQSRVSTGAADGTDGNVQLFAGDCHTDQVTPEP